MIKAAKRRCSCAPKFLNSNYEEGGEVDYGFSRPGVRADG